MIRSQGCGPEGWPQGRGWVTPVVSPSCPVLWSWVPVPRCGQALVLSLQAGAGVALLCPHSCGRSSLGGLCAGRGGGAGLADPRLGGCWCSWRFSRCWGFPSWSGLWSVITRWRAVGWFSFTTADAVKGVRAVQSGALLS